MANNPNATVKKVIVLKTIVNAIVLEGDVPLLVIAYNARIKRLLLITAAGKNNTEKFPCGITQEILRMCCLIDFISSAISYINIKEFIPT